jgi:polyhydroxyalkanoate synthesis regulator phasin
LGTTAYASISDAGRAFGVQERGERSERGEKKEASQGKRRLADAERKIRAAIKAGEISKKAGRKRLGELRKRLRSRKPDGQNGDSRGADTDSKRRTAEQVGRRIRAAVEEGKITREEGRKRMAEMRRSPRSAKPEKNRGQQKHDPRDIEAAKRRRFAAAQAKYKKTVAEARKRLEEAKKKLWPSAKPKKKGASNKAAKKRDSKDKGAQKRVRKQGQKKTNKVGLTTRDLSNASRLPWIPVG